MPVNENESTAKAASMGVGVDAIANPISGVQFGDPANFGGIVTINASASINQVTVSGVFNTSTSGVNFFAFRSGTATGGSGGTFSGLDPVTWIAIQVSGNALRIPVWG